MEAAIIHNLEQFFSKLRNDFWFMASRYSIRIDGLRNPKASRFTNSVTAAMTASDLR